MRILLVRPPVPSHTIGLKNIMLCEPLELEYVAAGLAGHDVQIFDAMLEKGLLDRLRSFRPDVVGTSCYITGVNEAKKVCRQVKSWRLSCRTVVGGVHASQCPEDFIDEAVDCIVLGDGTTVMPEVVGAIEQGLPLWEVPGLAIPVEKGLYRTPNQAYMPHADCLPLPRRDLVSHLKDQYYYLSHQPVALMKTTWGCWYKCNFCFTWRITDGTPYSRSPESIADELETISCEDVYIVDDIFLINRSRLARLATLIRERNIRKKFLVYGRADFISENEDVIKEWAALGLTAVLIGLEASTNQELDSMDKQCSVDHNRRAIAVLHRYGVDTYGSLIPQPDYTAEDWKCLWQFIDETGLYYVNISPLTPLPGTAIWEEYARKVLVPRSAHGLWDLSHCVLPTQMPLRDYYRSLLWLYMRTTMDVRRANKHTHRARPPMWSRKYWRLWGGAVQTARQFLRVHHHHDPTSLAEAMDVGPEVPGLREWRLQQPMPPAQVGGQHG